MPLKFPAFLTAAPLPPLRSAHRRLPPPTPSAFPSSPRTLPQYSRIHTNLPSFSSPPSPSYSSLSSSSSAASSVASISSVPPPPSLPNARDLASAAPHLLRPGRLFRGATPATLAPRPPSDAVTFLRTTDILLDLRSRDERRDDSPSVLAAACGPDYAQRERHIGLLNKRRVVFGLARVLPPGQARELAAQVVSNPLGARQVITSRMDDGGLLLLNRILVEAGAKAIGQAMQTLTQALREDGVGTARATGPSSVYFYCSAGKDRTGLLAALILTVLGVPERDIIYDYAKSSECWENGPYKLREDYCARLEHAGLTPLNWLGASPHIMEQTLKYIREHYGSVEDYLIHCNFGETRMNHLRQAMLLSS